MPGGLTIPRPLAAAGVAAAVTRFKLQVGAVRRVRKNFVHRIPIETLNGPGVQIVHDHHLVPYHLLARPAACPASGAWPWQIQVGFPEGVRKLSGKARCH
jgi:hypothetical protein